METARFRWEVSDIVLTLSYRHFVFRDVSHDTFVHCLILLRIHEVMTFMEVLFGQNILNYVNTLMVKCIVDFLHLYFFSFANSF
jgi:hypothetical protein